MEKESLHIQKEKNMMVSIKMIKRKEMERSYGLLEKNILENLKMTFMKEKVIYLENQV